MSESIIMCCKCTELNILCHMINFVIIFVLHSKEIMKKGRMSMDWFQDASPVNTSRLSLRIWGILKTEINMFFVWFSINFIHVYVWTVQLMLTLKGRGQHEQMIRYPAARIECKMLSNYSSLYKIINEIGLLSCIKWWYLLVLVVDTLSLNFLKATTGGGLASHQLLAVWWWSPVCRGPRPWNIHQRHSQWDGHTCSDQTGAGWWKVK